MLDMNVSGLIFPPHLTLGSIRKETQFSLFLFHNNRHYLHQDAVNKTVTELQYLKHSTKITVRFHIKFYESETKAVNSIVFHSL